MYGERKKTRKLQKTKQGLKIPLPKTESVKQSEKAAYALAMENWMAKQPVSSNPQERFYETAGWVFSSPEFPKLAKEIYARRRRGLKKK